MRKNSKIHRNQIIDCIHYPSYCDIKENQLNDLILKNNTLMF